MRVIVDLASPPAAWQRLGDGYRVEAVFIVWEREDALTVPASALFRRDDGWAVFAVEGGRARQREVTVGPGNGLLTEIVAGLEEGDTVIVHPGDAVSDGVRVRGFGPSEFFRPLAVVVAGWGFRVGPASRRPICSAGPTRNPHLTDGAWASFRRTENSHGARCCGRITPRRAAESGTNHHAPCDSTARPELAQAPRVRRGLRARPAEHVGFREAGRARNPRPATALVPADVRATRPPEPTATAPAPHRAWSCRGW